MGEFLCLWGMEGTSCITPKSALTVANSGTEGTDALAQLHRRYWNEGLFGHSNPCGNIDQISTSSFPRGHGSTPPPHQLGFPFGRFCHPSFLNPFAPPATGSEKNHPAMTDMVGGQNTLRHHANSFVQAGETDSATWVLCQLICQIWNIRHFIFVKLNSNKKSLSANGFEIYLAALFKKSLVFGAKLPQQPSLSPRQH
jgi:hypothetical protein